MQVQTVVIVLALLLTPCVWAAALKGPCDPGIQSAFRSGSEVEMDIRAGNIEILGSDAQMVRVVCTPGRNGSTRGVQAEFSDTAGRGRLRVHGGAADDVRIRIEVPKRTNVVVRSTAGDLDVIGIRGHKDVSLRAGDLTIDVGDPAEYRLAEASVTAGDIKASAFRVHKGGLFRSFRHENSSGQFRLKARLWAGDLKLQ